MQDLCSQQSLQEEFCTQHPNEPLVAVHSSNHQLMCNQCLFQSDLTNCTEHMAQLTFTSTLAHSLKQLFDQKFSAYQQNLQNLSSIRPERIS
jgi:hypothetical protein